jgi:hypothetical protein
MLARIDVECTLRAIAYMLRGKYQSHMRIILLIGSRRERLESDTTRSGNGEQWQ